MWETEPVPVAPGQHMRTASLATDPAGGTILALSSILIAHEGVVDRLARRRLERSV
jgi:hypothetical protein